MSSLPHNFIIQASVIVSYRVSAYRGPLYGREGSLFETASSVKLRSASQPLAGADALQCVPAWQQGYLCPVSLCRFQPFFLYIGVVLSFCCKVSCYQVVTFLSEKN